MELSYISELICSLELVHVAADYRTSSSHSIHAIACRSTVHGAGKQFIFHFRYFLIFIDISIQLFKIEPV